MKFRLLFLPLFVISLVFGGCNRKNDALGVDVEFPETLALSSEERPMNVVIKSGSIYLCGDYVVVYDRFENAEFHYAVFNRELEYLYSFCRKGIGPEECLIPTMVKDVDSNICFLRDHGNDNFYKYLLTDSGASFLGNAKLPSSETDFPFEINQLDDNRLLLKSTSYNKVRRQLWDFDKKEILDVLPPSFDYEERLGNKYHPEYDDFWLVADGENFMSAYFFADCIEFGTIDNDKLKIDKYVGSLDSKDLYWYEDEPKTPEFEYNVDYNTVYYESVATGLDSFWVAYAGVRWGDLKAHSKIIERYSLDGSPEVKYELSEAVESFIVLDNPDRIIGINPDQNEDNFLVYNL